MRPLKPALQYSEGRSSNWSGAVLTNAFAEKADGDKRDDFAIMASPGLTLWGAIGDGPIRGASVLNGVLYVVSGGMLYSVDNTGTETAIGVIGGNGPVRMASNYTELGIAADGAGYVYSGGALHVPVGYDVSDVIYFDGYIVWAVKDTERFVISALDDALTYDGADIAQVEGSPDNVLGMVNSHRELLFFGPSTIEVFYNSGNTAFPFERQGNSFVERGTLDRDSLVKIDNTVMFVGDDRIVYSMNGYAPQRVSTHAIEYLLRDATYARAWTYAQEGHLFYVLECDRGTVVFDRNTGAWHKRASYDSTYWRASCAVEVYGMLLFGDRLTGNLYVPSLDVHTENGDPLQVQIDLPTIDGDRSRLTMYAFEMVCETGVGNEAGSDPQVMLQYSDDGGHLWSNEMWRSMGLVGVNRTRVVWRRLGQFRQRQMRLKMTDNARRFVISYWADIS